MTITFEGASDDVVIVDRGAGDVEEYDAYNGATFQLRTDRERMQIGLTLETLSGCWHPSVGQVDETAPLPAWPVRFEQSTDRDYSVRLVVDAPNDAELVEIDA
ncbi:hypothetical protein [Rhodococcus opacus]|uniref:hypothetical protein n=1 Tax=Rhodococcus opacus TaxID=37919 RepID=UPI001C43BF65|nr:hypothetical protein [Rhodococcus opacus]MBV6758391.1 hypothetical protein [Rhodococcus opacus]